MEKLSEKYKAFKKLDCGFEKVKKDALKWMGSLAIAYTTIWGGVSLAEAKENKGEASDRLGITIVQEFENIASEMSFSELKSKLKKDGLVENTTFNYDFSERKSLDAWVKNVMTKTSKMSKVYDEFSKLDVDVLICEGLATERGVLGAYSPSLKQVLIDAKFVDSYLLSEYAPIKDDDDKVTIARMQRLLKHEIIHAVTADKLKIGYLDPESSMIAQMAFEIEARYKEGIEAFELGGAHWDELKSLAPETTIEIEKKAKENGWEIGKEIQNANTEQLIGRKLALSFVNDKIENATPNEAPDTAANLYKKFHSKAAMAGLFSGRMSLSPAQAVEKTDLKGLFSPDELTKAALPTKKEAKVFASESGKPYGADKIPVYEKASTWIVGASKAGAR